MSYSCKILLDSISPTGKRLTTFEITFPRIVLAEFNTHRMLSRNSASSRAIPFIKQVERILDNPFIPEQFPINSKGMQPVIYVTEGPLFEECKRSWLKARNNALDSAQSLYFSVSKMVQGHEGIKIHKQLVNRLLEPFMWHTVIVTATEWDNFFKLRTNEQAQYEIRRIADLMYDAYHAFDNVNENDPDLDGIWEKSGNIAWSAIRPQKLRLGEWHCPLVSEEDKLLDADIVFDVWANQVKKEKHIEQIETELLKQVSVARCARVSYLTHDGKRDIEKDLELFERLRTSGHWSPFEHVATPYFDEASFYYWKLNEKVMTEPKRTNRLNAVQKRSGNFIGWKQFRKEFADENCTNFRKEN